LIKLILPFYSLAWSVALPFLKRSPRVSLGWHQRTLWEAPAGPFDIWIQAASGGESLLTNMVLENLAARLGGKKLRVLATSGTKQGIDSLIKGRGLHPPGGNPDITVAYFPFDAPRLMEKAFSRFAPKLAIIVERVSACIVVSPVFSASTGRKKSGLFLPWTGNVSVKSSGRKRSA
jgi:3-deoxy-D-manno-octulosonic-acid transferase